MPLKFVVILLLYHKTEQYSTCLTFIWLGNCCRLEIRIISKKCKSTFLLITETNKEQQEMNFAAECGGVLPLGQTQEEMYHLNLYCHVNNTKLHLCMNHHPTIRLNVGRLRTLYKLQTSTNDEEKGFPSGFRRLNVFHLELFYMMSMLLLHLKCFDQLVEICWAFIISVRSRPSPLHKSCCGSI